MPTYLTPGVYVEEVPSANKPIEGVGTSVAAFVGLAPGGPVNTPMRISNWTQFAKIYGDPNEPDNGPFMEGAYLAHSVYGFFQNGGSLCWIVRVGEDGGNGAAGRARRFPPRPTPRRGLPRGVALEAVTDDVKVELTEEPSAARRTATRRTSSSSPPAPSKRGVRGPDAQEGPHQPRDEGQRGVEADQDRGDRRVAARGPARPATGTLHAVGAADRPGEGQADRLRGRRRQAHGHGRPRRRRRGHDGRDAGHHDASPTTATTSRSATSRAR